MLPRPPDITHTPTGNIMRELRIDRLLAAPLLLLWLWVPLSAFAQNDEVCSVLCTAHTNPEACYPLCLSIGGGTTPSLKSEPEQMGEWLAPYSSVCQTVAGFRARGKSDRQITNSLASVSTKQLQLLWLVLRRPGVLGLNLPRPTSWAVGEFVVGLTSPCPLNLD